MTVVKVSCQSQLKLIQKRLSFWDTKIYVEISLNVFKNDFVEICDTRRATQKL